MKKQFLKLAAFALLGVSLLGSGDKEEKDGTPEVVVSESENVSGVWEDTIVNVTKHLIVPKGSTLTIKEGVQIIFDTKGIGVNKTKIEIIVHGNLYCYGTKANPVTFTVPQGERTQDPTNSRLWGGIIGSGTCGEIMLDNVLVEYTGAILTPSSPSVTNGLFKAEEGEAMVAFNTNNTEGKYVITNSTFRYTGEDAIYVQGGSCIFTNNLFYGVGEAGGEAINVKAGCRVDAAYNVMYSPNTNAFKLSGSGMDEGRQMPVINAYNNTIVNAGWRRDPEEPKGGSVWAESGCRVNVFNNLIANSMFAAKAPDFGEESEDAANKDSKIDYNFYASGTVESTIAQHITNGNKTAFDGFKDEVEDVVYGANDKRGAAAGDNDPKFVNFPFATNPLLSYTYDNAWDFRLQASSPALTGANKDYVTPLFVTTGITVDGKTYNSPAPAAYFGAFGAQ